MKNKIFRGIASLALLFLFTAGQFIVNPRTVFATVADNYEPVKLLGNGTTVDFSFGWALIAQTNIRVYLESVSTGVQTLKTLGSDYTVVFNDTTPGGTVTFTTAPTASYYVVIGRLIDKRQELPFTTSAGFQAKVIEGRLDKLTAQTQDLKEDTDRAVKVRLGGTNNILIAEPVANKGLKWDATGTIIENSTVDLDVVVADSAASAAAALVSQNAAASSASGALSSKNSADADAVQTAIDRIQTGLDRTQTGLDKVATAADRVQTGLDKIATNADVVLTHADEASTHADAEDAEDNATIAQNSAATVTSMYSAVSAAQAQANALLGLGIGSSVIDSEGNLIMTYNAATVTGITINAGGELIVTY